jgi:hypothetical protein
VIVDAQVTDSVDALAAPGCCAGLLDDKGSSLLAAPISAGRLTGFERCDQALYQRTLYLHERSGHRLHDRAADERHSAPVNAAARPSLMTAPS